jgi:hypothetical protein
VSLGPRIEAPQVTHNCRYALDRLSPSGHYGRVGTRYRMRNGCLALTVVLALGCDGHVRPEARPSTSAPSPTRSTAAVVGVGGAIVGRLFMPMQGRKVASAGSVTATQPCGDVTETVRTDRFGRFELRLPVGEYTVTGNPDAYRGQAVVGWPPSASTVVRRNAETVVDLESNEKASLFVLACPLTGG